MRAGAKSSPDAWLVLGCLGLLFLMGEELPCEPWTIAEIVDKLDMPRSTVHDRVNAALPLVQALGRPLRTAGGQEGEGPCASARVATTRRKRSAFYSDMQETFIG